ncbi:DUF3800 domain-containing protein [Nostoc punctiforme UO1]|uniref:DUF3800 domain-containing protein n=1 Tax=Nostoc punctiforme TaxID=272131 RepID=UPI00309C303F
MRIYTDESCTQADQGNYMLIGGIVCDKETSKEIRKAIQTLINHHGLPNGFEFHFADITSNKIEIYKKFCDIFFDFYSQKCSYQRGIKQTRTYRRICFEGMLISHAKIDHFRFSQGDRELGFFRFYYTLLAHTLSKHHFAERQFHATIDAINTKDPKMVPNLHQRLKTSCLPEVVEPIKTVHRQDSKAELLLQMADVMLGSVSFAWNKLPTDTSKRIEAKREVFQHVENKLGKILSKPTHPASSFNIWELNMQ